GSVGEPRDGSAVASYCVFDDATQQLFFRRVEFNLAALARDIQQQPGLELPWFLTEHAPGALPEKREHAIRVGKVATIKLHVRAGSRVRMQVGRNQKLTTTPVVAPLPPPVATPAAATTDAVLAVRQRRMIWIAGGFFALAASLLLVAAVVYFKNVQSTSRSVVSSPSVAQAPVAPPVPTRVITLLAKDAQLHGAALRKENLAGGINIGYWQAPMDFVSWTVTVEQAGSYDCSIVYAVPASASGRDFEIRCGNARLFHKHLASTGDWQKYQTLYLGRLQLAVGVQELEMKPVGTIRMGLMNLREVRLQRASD
ncbi:MAG: hypothetical protein NTY53_21165, partial [Kiritimatiellaeota bacterium]|nr:hypothetical protein [Kiritimatiellota bacterium]